MNDYIIALVGSSLLLLISIYYFRDFFEEGKSFKGKLGLIFAILFSSGLFIYSILDAPKILLNQKEIIEGECEIKENTGYSGIRYISIYFYEIYEDNNYFTFPIKKYPLIHEGDFYCELEHYRDTDIEISLNLFTSQNGKELKIK
ncbi:hypothetical protein [Halalkalibacter urbisdiaboli]|uniref:hypothetical protein n=1 Tax=Halalkalibacter urbisdiaboli TaxID=1960589 RepID=UPI000B4416AE|nr:hypothetical protein [Halalkalibacter urbisdiaboli]